MRIAAIAFCVFLACCPAFAAISNVAPTSFYVGSVEEYIQLDGSGLSGTDSTDIVFSGPAGTYTVAPNLEADTSLTVWVPVPVLITAGHYSVTVNANDSGGGVRTSGPAFFDVIERPLDGPPLLGLPEIIYAEAAGPTGAVVTFTPNAASQGGTSLSLTCDHASGTLFPLGTTTVHCTATDTFGSAAGTFLVVVGDTRPPVLTLPGDITTSSTTVTWSASATDNIDGAITPDCSPASGSTFAVGTTTVVCTATDARANLARGQFHVTVLQGPPTLVLPDDFFVEATSGAGAIAGYVVTSVPDSVITCTPPSGATFPLGTTTVQCSGTNVGGTATGSFKITVRDTTAPQILSVTATPNVLAPPNHLLVPVVVTVVATDAVDPAPASHIVSVTSNQLINGPGDGNTQPDWVIIGPLTIQLRAERSGVFGDRIYTLTIETTDFSGNVSRAATQVRVPQAVRRRSASEP